MSAEHESDRLDPQPSELKLSTGHVVLVERLRTRQFFKLVKILTRGAGPMLFQVNLDFNLPDAEFAGRMLGLIAMSIPEAEDQAIEFIQSMVRPADLVKPSPSMKLTPAEETHNQDVWLAHREAIINPELEDTLDIMEKIASVEASDLRRLGKRLRSMFKVAQATGQLTPDSPVSSDTETSTLTGMSEDSPEQ